MRTERTRATGGPRGTRISWLRWVESRAGGDAASLSTAAPTHRSRRAARGNSGGAVTRGARGRRRWYKSRPLMLPRAAALTLLVLGFAACEAAPAVAGPGGAPPA